MPKILLFAISLGVIILTVTVVLVFQKSTPKSEIDTAVNQANLLYNQRKLEGQDFSNGPCLSNALMPGWVLDIVHNPRLSTDDLAQNQCPSFREGSASHFVELDLEGNLVRAR
ncbi:MAG: hypothetical protein Q7R77_04210 [Candidatus Daviesbacteria bacterium]|nr:hypothetical protein [Candidatus Daviesbacteria bacterium]